MALFHKKPIEKHIATKEELEELENIDWLSKQVLKFSGAALAVIIFGVVLSIVSTSKAADNSSSANISVTIPIACTLSSSSNSYSATMSPGTLNSNVGTSKINAYCNDNNGYVIYAAGAGTDTDKTDMVSSVASSYNIKTGTATSGSTSAWALKITGGSGTTPPTISGGFEDGAFHTIPSTYTAIASRQSSTDMTKDTTSSGSFINATYQVYASSTQPSGNYTGKVMYAMLHPYTSSNLVDLEDAIEAANKAAAGTVGTITKDGVAYYKMQDLTTTICDNVTILGEASQLQMIDSRDNSLYYVTKLQDGQCWMTQNLDLDLSTSKTLTSNDTNLETYGSKGYDSSNGYTCSNSASDCSGGTISWTPERSTSTALSDWTNDYNNPYSYDRGEVYPDGTNVHKLAGNYYNWSAAIASNNSSSFSSNTLDNPSASPKNSVCPSNWRLPTIASYTQYQLGNNEFYNLDYYYNSGLLNTATGLMNAPLYFARSGVVYGGSLNGSGSSGYYWSSTVYGSSTAYRLYFNSGGVNPTYNVDGLRYNGFSVRCVVGG